MVLEFRYYDDTQKLVPQQRYTIAQNNCLCDSISICSTDPSCRNYNYCLEFVCYNNKSVPQKQYVSSILQYGEKGLNYVIPSELTAVAGFVDIQLVGYNKANNEIVFHSVSKNCRAFDVQQSLNVLQNNVTQTPNVLTDLLKELDYVREIKNNIANDFRNTINNEFNKVLEPYHYYCINYFLKERLVFSEICIEKSAIKPPQVDLPRHCVIDGGWFDLDTGQKLQENAVVEKNTNFVLNFKSIGVECDNYLAIKIPPNGSDLYLPYYDNQGNMVRGIDDTQTFDIANAGLHIPPAFDSVEKFEHIAVRELYIDAQSPHLQHIDNCIVNKNTHKVEFFRQLGEYGKKVFSPDNYDIGKGAFRNAIVGYITLGQNVQTIQDEAFKDCVYLKEIVLPNSIKELGENLVQGCIRLEKIVIHATTPPSKSQTTFLNGGKNIKISVSIDAYQNYIDAGWQNVVVENNQYLEKVNSIDELHSNIEQLQQQNVLIFQAGTDADLNFGFPQGIPAERSFFLNMKDYDYFLVYVKVERSTFCIRLERRHSASCGDYQASQMGAIKLSDLIQVFATVQITEGTYIRLRQAMKIVNGTCEKTNGSIMRIEGGKYDSSN